MMASLGNFETLNFETLGGIVASQNAQFRNARVSGTGPETGVFYLSCDRVIVTTWRLGI